MPFFHNEKAVESKGRIWLNPLYLKRNQDQGQENQNQNVEEEEWKSTIFLIEIYQNMGKNFL